MHLLDTGKYEPKEDTIRCENLCCDFFLHAKNFLLEHE